MKKYLILAAADISKAQQSTNASSSSQHRNITIDSDEASSTSTYSYNNHSGSTTRNGSIKFILKEIFPIESDELITALNLMDEWLSNRTRIQVLLLVKFYK